MFRRRVKADGAAAAIAIEVHDELAFADVADESVGEDGPRFPKRGNKLTKVATELQRRALSIEASYTWITRCASIEGMVGAIGFEPMTSTV